MLPKSIPTAALTACSNWSVTHPSIVQWPELCGLGAISLTTKSPLLSSNNSIANIPIRSISLAIRRAIFLDNLETLSQYSSQINNEYDMLYLCGSQLSRGEKISKNIIKTKRTLTTGSYLITEIAMKYLVNNINSYSKEIDVFYADEIQTKFKCFYTSPPIAKQRDGYSDIQQGMVSYSLKQ